MDGLRDPIGGKPPEIYWRRRIVAAIGVVLVFVVIYFLATSPGGKADGTVTSKTNAPQVSSDASPDPTILPSGDASRPCTSADVTLTMAANPGTFAGSALPVFDVAIKQTGSSPCRLDTAAADTEILITSGSDRIFSSLDCPADATINARQFLLQPDANEAFQVTWNRKRSAPECATVSADPRPGTYHAILTVQGIEGNDTTFVLSE